MEQLTIQQKSRFGGHFVLECFRWHDENGVRFRDAKGRFERRLIWREESKNIIPDEELNHILDVEFHAATQITTWYCCLSESDTAAAAGMTYAVPVYTEVNAAIDEATRPEFEEAASASESLTNSANKATFTFNAAKTIYGASIVGGGTDGNTKGDAAGGGTLACYSKLGIARDVINNDVINMTYTIGSADA